MPRVQVSYISGEGVMFQDCLTVALLIVSPSLCSLSRFLANNGNGKLSLDGYFVHQQSVIQHLWRWRALSVNLPTMPSLNSWSLRIAPAHSRVGEWAHLLRRKPIDWLWNTCRRNATERRKLLKSVLRGSRALCHSVQGAAINLRNCSSIKLAQL